MARLWGRLPNHHPVLYRDGAYASLAGRSLPRTHLASRFRKDAALFDTSPARWPGQCGRPHQKGERLPSLEEIARSAPADERSDLIVDVRGAQVRRRPGRCPSSGTRPAPIALSCS